jgi:hypothetical protein
MAKNSWFLCRIEYNSSYATLIKFNLYLFIFHMCWTSALARFIFTLERERGKGRWEGRRERERYVWFTMNYS